MCNKQPSQIVELVEGIPLERYKTVSWRAGARQAVVEVSRVSSPPRAEAHQGKPPGDEQWLLCEWRSSDRTAVPLLDVAGELVVSRHAYAWRCAITARAFRMDTKTASSNALSPRCWAQPRPRRQPQGAGGLHQSSAGASRSPIHAALHVTGRFMFHERRDDRSVRCRCRRERSSPSSCSTASTERGGGTSRSAEP